ncbi:sacsin N-terminal ATP-binding-like domain-containing protein [Micromonospora tulbaghiae]
MTIPKVTSFEQLYADRRSYVDTARRNGFEAGLRSLLSELYPDNAHFIYELLQNAEDAGAREVSFDLRPHGLRVEHDGRRLFDLRDIASITGIGQSTKKDDTTTIGKFGVGFKAVFAYTEAPEIHSGEHSFAVHDLFVPTRISGEAAPDRTTFWFPFNRAAKPADRAAAEVAAALRDISATTLLFLNHIALISCSLPGGEERLIERHSVDGHIIKIETDHDGEPPSYWYRVTGNVEVDGRPYPAAAAFALQPPSGEQRGPKRFIVKPDKGRVFIYFPAVKETSGLRFHIHSQFASTVARDSVRDDPGNDELVAGIGELIVAALPAMREAGLITDGLLETLPNKRDDLPDRYDVLRTQIIEAFDSEKLTPVAGGGHAPATELWRTDYASVRSALSVDDADFLWALTHSGNEWEPSPGWLRSAEGRAKAFLDSLTAANFDRDLLTRAMREVARWYTTTDPRLHRWTSWLAAKHNDWLRKFYVALGDLSHDGSDSPESHLLRHELMRIPLVRVHHGIGFDHVRSSAAHLPTAPGARANGLVPDSLVVFGEDNSREGRALRQFYQGLDVRPWDAAAQLDACFSLYGSQPGQRLPAVTDEHLADLLELKKLIERGAISATTYADKPIFVALRRDGTTHWASARSIYLDDPFVLTGLSALYQSQRFPGHPLSLLSPDYADQRSLDVAVMVELLGATSGLTIEQVRIWDNPRFKSHWRYDGNENSNMISRDWVIPHLALIVSTEDEALLRNLWKTVVSADAGVADAVYQSNRSKPSRVIDSRLAQDLSSAAWILDRDGNFRRPEDMTVDELADGLGSPANSELLRRAGFGRKAAADAQQEREYAEFAKKLGFVPEQLRTLAELAEKNPEKLAALVADAETQVRLPGGSSLSPESRSRRAGEVAAKAPQRRYDDRVRSVRIQVPGHISDARSYLRRHYTNDDGELICQICLLPMPFQIRTGDYYFEAVQFVRDAGRDLQENRLALCPTCAAKYQHARGTKLEDLRIDLLTQEIGHREAIAIDVVLAGVPRQVRFVGKHAIDLQAALVASEASLLDEDDIEFDN